MGAAGKVVGPYAMGVLFDWNGFVPVAWLAVIISVLSVSAFVVHSSLNKSTRGKLADSI
ncbi:hypothetical protein D3C76_1780650 [compost metagenome]